jgi:CheY-like chemotaxis protein
MFIVRTTQKGIFLNLEMDIDNLGLICQDEAKIRQVLINLLGNAVKFTQKGKIDLRVKIQSLTQDAHASELNNSTTTPLILLFEVEDTGIGIPQDEQAYIFEAFNQAESGLNIADGTGLGLTISRQYAKLMGGDLEIIRSEVDRGSSFRFTVPAKTGKEMKIDRAQNFLSVERLKPGQPEFHILVVDDLDFNRDILSQMLTKVGFIVHTAKNGKEAVEMISKIKPHGILMDIRMPVMDGMEATKKIKSMPEGKNIQVISVSASALDEQRGKVIANGADSFIKKPIKKEELLEELRLRLGVEYVYRENKTKIIKKNESTVFTSSDIEGLPDSLIKKMKQAAIIGNMAELKSLINEIAGIDSDLATVLADRLNNFDLKPILKLFSPGEE